MSNIGQITTRPPGMDTIQEYRVEMSVPSAKYSAPVTAIFATRSGTNDWHGGLFYTGRNNGFGVARQRQDFYTKPPEYILNEYGASLGGPVRIPHLYNGKDRMFFFTAWEAYSLRSASTFSTSVPTQAMQQGNFSQLTNSLSQPITLYDPWSTGRRGAKLFPRAVSGQYHSRHPAQSLRGLLLQRDAAAQPTQHQSRRYRPTTSGHPRRTRTIGPTRPASITGWGTTTRSLGVTP